MAIVRKGSHGSQWGDLSQSLWSLLNELGLRGNGPLCQGWPLQLPSALVLESALFPLPESQIPTHAGTTLGLSTDRPPEARVSEHLGPADGGWRLEPLGSGASLEAISHYKEPWAFITWPYFLPTLCFLSADTRWPEASCPRCGTFLTMVTVSLQTMSQMIPVSLKLLLVKHLIAAWRKELIPVLALAFLPTEVAELTEECWERAEKMCSLCGGVVSEWETYFTQGCHACTLTSSMVIASVTLSFECQGD